MLDYKRYRTMVVNMCGSLDAAKEASRGGNTKRLSHHTETSGYEALLHETNEDDVDDDDHSTFRCGAIKLRIAPILPSHRSRTLAKGTMVFIDCDNYGVQWKRRVQDSLWWFVSEVPK